MPRRTLALDISSREHRLTLDAPGAPVPDGAGGYLETFAPLDPAELWGMVEPMSQADLERVSGSTVEATATHLITLPFHPQVTVQTRVTYHGRTFLVQGIRNVLERNVTLELTCEEVLAA
jgi:SPP1 family predicted phage head-tail adaptor